MKSKDASKLGHEIETLHDLLKDSSDAVNSGLLHGSPSSSIESSATSKKTRRMVIMDELPFRIAKHEGFRDFCNMMQPRFQVPSSPL
ncbi:hypothetical protein V6N13_113895 [Hibiscus sabdariffa]